jgi:hypothetical protein
MSGSRMRKAALAVAVAVLGSLAIAAPASTDSVTPISSFNDPRGDLPNRPGQLVRGLYGPYTIQPNSEIHNAVNFAAPVPCTNCYVTDLVANLVDTSGNTVNLGQDVMMHHFVLADPSRTDVVCPNWGMPPSPVPLGRRFFAAGNERTHMHLPSPYGYYNSSSTNSWTLIYHLVNKSETAAKTVNIEIVYRYRTTGIAATPLWLDIDGCGDSEYTAPMGYSDTHVDWTSNIDGRFIGLAGHLHDVDITNLSKCLNNTDDDGDGLVNDGCPALNTAETQCTNALDDDSDGRINDGCPAVGTAEGQLACPDHCPEKGHGIAVSTEIRNGPPGDYFGPIPPNRATPSDLTGATVCRSEGYYGTPWAGTAWRGHLDTMSLCGIFQELPAGHQSEPYPPDGEFPIDGYPLKPGQVVRLHSEYQNDTGLPQTDVMGIVMAWVAPTTPGYARPKGASPTTIRFVPAYNSCTSGNAVHGVPFANSACSPPVQTSDYLTIGSPDSNGLPSASSGVAIFKAVGETPIDPTNGDQADVQITGQITDVRRKSGLSLYTGQVQLSMVARITDRYNVTDQATVQDVPFNITSACTNGTCNLATTFDAAVPNVIREGKRAVWQLGQVKIFDGGPDDSVATADNTLFAVQGLYAP